MLLVLFTAHIIRAMISLTVEMQKGGTEALKTYELIQPWPIQEGHCRGRIYLDLHPSVAAYLCNATACWAKLGDIEVILEDVEVENKP